MKRILPLSLIIMLAISFNLSANNSDLFSYDRAAVESELAELTELENYIAENPATTLSLLETTENNLISGLDLASPNAMGLFFDDPPLGIPSFLWGCAFGVVGVAIVYFVTDEDKDETRKSFYGCVTSTVIYGVLYAVLWSSWFTAVSI